MKFTKPIYDWFKQETGGSLILPDGWYGRPYDNLHMLTSLDEAGTVVIIVLDRKLTLKFEGLSKIEACGEELVFGPFEKLHFDWETYDINPERGSKEYFAGYVRIVSGRVHRT